MSASVELADVSKIYEGGIRAVDGVNMAIEEGEFFSLLGPSGCGKTTSLRMIAGFETPSEGIIRVAGEDVTGVPAHKRDMGMVFQNYALFPHRTVRENVAFGLRMRRIARAEIARKVDEALAMVALTGFEDRRPDQLSGGQQQRVALARAIIIEPRVLLCDEPLGALDRKLRQTMQFELKQLQKTLGLTLIFVTHDQEEALAMSDRIAVLNHGRVEQIGTPVEIYDSPATAFVADFIGNTNLFRGEVAADMAGKPALRVGKALSLPLPPVENLPRALSVALRPEKIRLRAANGVNTGIEGRIESANFQGGFVLYRVQLADDRRILAQQPNSGAGQTFSPGALVALEWNASDLVILKD